MPRKPKRTPEEIRERDRIKSLEYYRTHSKRAILSYEEKARRSRERAIQKSTEAHHRGNTMNPATADVIYSEREWEFISAVDALRRSSGRKFLASSDYLAVVDALGYVRPEGNKK